jgi:hypothetical protein
MTAMDHQARQPVDSKLTEHHHYKHKLEALTTFDTSPRRCHTCADATRGLSASAYSSGRATGRLHV